MLLLALLLAQAPEANLSLLRPASGSDGLLGVEGARPLDEWTIYPSAIHRVRDERSRPLWH